jgi:hypothetical protein
MLLRDERQERFSISHLSIGGFKFEVQLMQNRER